MGTHQRRMQVKGKSSEWAPGTIREAYEKVVKEESGRLLGYCTDFLRRIIAPVCGMGGVTLSCVFQHYNSFLLEDYTWWVSTTKKHCSLLCDQTRMKRMFSRRTLSRKDFENPVCLSFVVSRLCLFDMRVVPNEAPFWVCSVYREPLLLLCLVSLGVCFSINLYLLSLSSLCVRRLSLSSRHTGSQRHIPLFLLLFSLSSLFTHINFIYKFKHSDKTCTHTLNERYQQTKEVEQSLGNQQM